MPRNLSLVLIAATLTYKIISWQSSFLFVVAPSSTVCGCSALNATTTSAMHADGVPAGAANGSSPASSRDACIATCTNECMWVNHTKEISECYAKKFKSTTQTLSSAQPCAVGTQCLWGCWEDSEAAYYGTNDSSTQATTTTSAETTTAMKSGSTPAGAESTTLTSASGHTNDTTSSGSATPTEKHTTPADAVFLQCADKQKCCQSLSGCQTTNGTFCDAYSTFYRSLDECFVPYEPACAKACAAQC